MARKSYTVKQYPGFLSKTPIDSHERGKRKGIIARFLAFLFIKFWKTIYFLIALFLISHSLLLMGFKPSVFSERFSKLMGYVVTEQYGYAMEEAKGILKDPKIVGEKLAKWTGDHPKFISISQETKQDIDKLFLYVDGGYAITKEVISKKHIMKNCESNCEEPLHYDYQDAKELCEELYGEKAEIPGPGVYELAFSLFSRGISINEKEIKEGTVRKDNLLLWANIESEKYPFLTFANWFYVYSHTPNEITSLKKLIDKEGGSFPYLNEYTTSKSLGFHCALNLR